MGGSGAAEAGVLVVIVVVAAVSSRLAAGLWLALAPTWTQRTRAEREKVTSQVDQSHL